MILYLCVVCWVAIFVLVVGNNSQCILEVEGDGSGSACLDLGRLGRGLRLYWATGVGVRWV